MTDERWLIVPSIPVLEASSFGRLRVIPYQAANGRTYGGKPQRGRLHKGRRFFAFREKTYMVHRLVCEAFNGPPPSGKPNCLHIDEDSGNNKPTNLRWGTQKENLNAPGFLTYCRSRVGEKSPVVKGRAAA